MGEALAIILTSTNSDKEADFMSNILIESEYVACVNILPNIISKYFWKGELQKTNEIILIIKTKKDFFKQIEKLIIQNHSYKIPEIVCINVADTSIEYGNWIVSNIGIKKKK